MRHLLAIACVLGCHHSHARFEGDGEDDDRPRHHHDDIDDEDDDPETDAEPPAPPRHLPAAHLAPEPGLLAAEVAPTAPGARPWPLTELPSTQPHLDAAMARDACTTTRAVHPDVRAYLDAWCGRDVDARIAALAPLARSARADVMRAARLDVIDLTANGRDAVHALARLDELELATADNLDLLAATYVGLLEPVEAVAVAAALGTRDPKPSPRRACERMLAWEPIDAVLANDIEQDDDCGRRASAVACALRAAGKHRGADAASRLVAMRECFVELPDDPDRDRKLELILVHARWGPHLAERWLDLSRHAEIAIGLPQGEAHAVTALSNALLASECEISLVDEVRDAASRIAARPGRDPALDAELAVLAKMTTTECVVLHP